MKRFILRKPQNIPLRNVLVIPFLLQVIAAVGLVGYLSFRNGQQAVNTLASQLRGELSSRIQRELQGYFETPHEINRLNATALREGSLDVINATRGEALLFQQMKIAPTVAFVYCGSAQKGEFLGVLRSPEDGSLQLSHGNTQNGFLRDYYGLDIRGHRTHYLYQADQTYDARQRPWYRAALAKNGPIWTDVYLAFTTRLPNVTASLPVYDRTGNRLLGVCATDVVLPEEFRDFLSRLEIGKSGQAFVVDRQGQLIASSTDEPLMVESGNDIEFLQALNSRDLLVKGTATYVTTRLGGFENIFRSQQLTFKLNGQRQFLEILPFKDGLGLDWFIVVVVPESDFMGHISQNNRLTLLLCLLALLVAATIGTFTARQLNRTIDGLSQTTRALAEGDLNQTVQPSQIYELEVLGRSFNTMAHQLKQSFSALKQSEERFKSLIANIPGVIYRCQLDQNWTMSFISDAVIDISGYPATDFTNNQVRTFASIIYPEDAELVEQGVNQALLQHRPYVLEYRIRHQDGQLRWVIERGQGTFDSQGHCQYLDGAIFDITEQKLAADALRQSEATNRALLAAIPDMLIRASGSGVYLDIAGRERVQLYGQQAFRVGTTVYDSLAEEQAAIRIKAIRDALETGDIQVYEQQLDLDTGIQYEEVRVVVSGDNEVLIMVRDITERIQNEKLKAENLRLGAELDIARQIQQLILPKATELTLKGLDIEGFMEPADEVGGDYYDVLEIDGVVTIAIGDVTGHGLESGILMLMAQTSVRTLKEVREVDPVRFLDTLNRTLFKNLERMNSNKNLTLAILNYADGILSISGQHEDVLIFRQNGDLQRVNTVDLGFPIGLDDPIIQFIGHTQLELQPGDGVVLYTDGITEAANAAGQRYGLERLCDVVQQHWHCPVAQVKDAVIGDLRAFIGQRKVVDDITLLLLKRQVDPPALISQTSDQKSLLS